MYDINSPGALPPICAIGMLTRVGGLFEHKKRKGISILTVPVRGNIHPPDHHHIIIKTSSAPT